MHKRNRRASPIRSGMATKPKKHGLLISRVAARILHICANAVRSCREVQVILEEMPCEVSAGVRGLPAPRLFVAVQVVIRHF